MTKPTFLFLLFDSKVSNKKDFFFFVKKKCNENKCSQKNYITCYVIDSHRPQVQPPFKLFSSNKQIRFYNTHNITCFAYVLSENELSNLLHSRETSVNLHLPHIIVLITENFTHQETDSGSGVGEKRGWRIQIHAQFIPTLCIGVPCYRIM